MSEPALKKARLSPFGHKIAGVGDKMPSVVVDCGFGDDQEKVNMAERCAGKKVLLLGLPGAFTPC